MAPYAEGPCENASSYLHKEPSLQHGEMAPVGRCGTKTQENFNVDVLEDEIPEYEKSRKKNALVTHKLIMIKENT